MGCETKTASKPQQESHLKPLALMFGQYTGQHRGQTPSDEAAFKQFVRSNTAFLSNFKVDGENVFVSERDGKPYVILVRASQGSARPCRAPRLLRTNRKASTAGGSSPNSLGAVQEVDEIRFRELVPSGQ